MSLDYGGAATAGACSIDCNIQLALFIAVNCITSLIRSSGMACNFLLTLRSVHEEDKTASMATAFSITCLLGYIPSPVFFGWMIDQTCLIWGKTCTGTGNCWLYDGKLYRILSNGLAIIAVTLGTVFDVGVWYTVKHLKIYDDAEEAAIVEIKESNDEANGQSLELNSK